MVEVVKRLRRYQCPRCGKKRVLVKVGVTKGCPEVLCRECAVATGRVGKEHRDDRFLS